MKKILFLIHDLGQGGAEKVLINLVNNMDKTKFDITVMAVFAGGVNERFLSPDIKYKTVFKKMIPGNSKLMKTLSPQQLHKLFIKEKYDIEVSYLEGPSARIISGCPDKNTKLYCWIHSNHFSMSEVACSFRSEKEADECYKRFDKVICVSRFMKENFCQWVDVRNHCCVLYNTVESDNIIESANEELPFEFSSDSLNIIAVGSLKEVKGFDRLLRIMKRFKDENKKIHLFILGKGPLKNEFESYIGENNLQNYVTLLGYDTNPYKYVKSCDLFVCSSHSEGFSTAATEALILGTPVCTVDVSGMREMLGENNEYGVITENNEQALYEGINNLFENKELLAHYKEKSLIRGKLFNTEATVKAVEEMFIPHEAEH